MLYGLNMSVLLLTRPHGLMPAWANHLAHLSTLAMSVTANIWDTSQNMLVALVPAMSLHVLLLWLKCRYSSLSVALERWSEMVGDNLLGYFQVRWICGSTWLVTRIEHRTLCPLMCFTCTQWTGNILKPVCMLHATGRNHFPINSFKSWFFSVYSALDFVHLSPPEIKPFRFHHTLATL